MRTPHRRFYEVFDASQPDAPKIGRLSVPVKQSSRSGTPSESSPSAAKSRSSTSGLPAFQYDAQWLLNGFPIGADLKFDGSVQLPLPGRMLFGFLEDRAVSRDALAVRTGSPSLKADGFSAENSALLAPDFRDAAGGLRIVPEESGAPVPAVRIQRSTQLAETMYAWHAFERGKAKPPEFALLQRALTLPGRHPVFTVERQREAQVVRLRGMHDQTDRPLWLSIALETAARCGIAVAETAVEREMGETIFFSRRIDRAALRPGDPRTEPRLVLSARTLAALPVSGRTRPQGVSYFAIADILNREGASPKTDLPEVWRRMVYTLLAGPEGDRPERWLFVREPLGWRLAPAHSLEWISPGVSAAGAGLTLDGRKRMTDPDDAVSTAPYFGLTVSEAKAQLMQMRRVLSGWESIAYDAGADPHDIALMAAAFSDF